MRSSRPPWPASMPSTRMVPASGRTRPSSDFMKRRLAGAVGARADPSQGRPRPRRRRRGPAHRRTASRRRRPRWQARRARRQPTVPGTAGRLLASRPVSATLTRESPAGGLRLGWLRDTRRPPPHPAAPRAAREVQGLRARRRVVVPPPAADDGRLHAGVQRALELRHPPLPAGGADGPDGVVVLPGRRLRRHASIVANGQIIKKVWFPREIVTRSRSCSPPASPRS